MFKFKAEIEWMENNASGQPLINSVPYRPIIVFENEKYFPENAQPVFSAEIFNTEVDNKTSIAVVELKTKKISTAQTKPGTGFYLYEVLKKVAYGKIIEVSDG